MLKRAYKREASIDEDVSRTAKVRKLAHAQLSHVEHSRHGPSHIQFLPDELLLRVLSFLTVDDLIKAQGISRRMCNLAKDSQLWKRLYYERFVYRRFGRVVKDVPTKRARTNVDTTASGHRDKIRMEWKSRYRLSHKWSNGTCNYREIMLATTALPRTFLCLRGNMAITVDNECGLRAWKTQDEKQTLVASFAIQADDELPNFQPTALSAEIDKGSQERLNIVVGSAEGHIKLFTFDISNMDFYLRHAFCCFQGQAVSALAQSNGGYFLAMADNQAISVFRACWIGEGASVATPQVVSSLRSQSDRKPVSVNLRTSATTLMACIIYAYPRFLSGWSVGIQELRWNITTHDLLSTRLATSAQPNSSSRTGNTLRTEYLPPTPTKPTSLCYTHPYLLATHPDNTLSLYMVRSTDTELSIGSGMRLWGHTSDVCAANIGDRGKAVTIAYGGDVRIWQLEEGLTSALARKATPGPLVSVKLQPTPAGQPDVKGVLGDFKSIDERESGGAPEEEVRAPNEQNIASVDFDEERLVVLQNKDTESQALFIYDFT